MIDRFVLLSGDHSPIHVKDEAARALNYRERVAHGLLLDTLVSGVVGRQSTSKAVNLRWILSETGGSVRPDTIERRGSLPDRDVRANCRSGGPN